MESSTAGRDDCYYRVLTGTGVKYVIVQAGALNADSLMDMPLDFQSILPSLPYDKNDWNQAYISRNAASGELVPILPQIELPGVQTIRHSEMINFLDLERTQQLGLLAQECVWKPGSPEGDDQLERRKQRTMIVKMARFPLKTQYMERETQIYQLLQPSEIAPRFLGHIHEGGRVIGYLLEKVEGRPASWGDFKVCETTLRRLRDLNILHGDCNRYNFIVSPNDRVTLIDFDNAKVNVDTKTMDSEVASLAEQLQEDTGRGGGVIEAESS